MVIYLDSGKLEDMEAFGPVVSGLTTNPTLIKGVSDYKTYAQQVLKTVSGNPVLKARSAGSSAPSSSRRTPRVGIREAT